MASKPSTPAPRAPTPGPSALKNVGSMLGKAATKVVPLARTGVTRLAGGPFGILGQVALAGAEKGAEDYTEFMKMNPELEGQHYPYGMKRGGKVKSGSASRRADGMAHKGKTKGKMVKMREGGAVGSFRRNADGIASKGKTRGKIVKMRYGGEC